MNLLSPQNLSTENEDFLSLLIILKSIYWLALKPNQKKNNNQTKTKHKANQLEGAKPELLPLLLQLFPPDKESFIYSARHFFVNLIIWADILYASHKLGHPLTELQAAAGPCAAETRRPAADVVQAF